MGVVLNVISQFNSKGLDQAQKELDHLKSKTESASGKLMKAGTAISASFAAIGGAIAAFAVDQTSKLEDANAQLDNAFKNAGTTVEAHKGKLDKVGAQLEKYGYTNAQTAEAVARMTTVNGNAKLSLDSMGLASDIAKNRHMDLTKAGDLLAKTMAGSTTAAKKMGIAIPDSVAKIQDPAQKSAAMMKILQGHFKGSADAAAGTLKGKIDAAKASLGDMAAKIGEKLVPIISKLVGWLMKAVDWFKHHKAVMIAVAAIVGGIVLTVLAAYVVSMMAAAVATVAATWPILLIIGIIALLVLGVIMMWKHFAWFRTAVKEVWKAIKEYIHIAWNDVIKPIWHAIVWYIKNVLVPIFKAIWDIVKKVFDKAGEIISGAWDKIKKVFKWIKDGVQGVIDIFGSIVDKIGSAFSGVGQAIWKGIKWGLNKAIAGLNTLIHAANNVTGLIPGVGSALHIPDIPKLARGGSVSAGNPYIVGDGGGPELFVPSQSGTIVPSGKFNAGGTIIQNISITSNDPQQVVNALIRYQQRNGSVPIKVR